MHWTTRISRPTGEPDLYGVPLRQLAHEGDVAGTVVLAFRGSPATPGEARMMAALLISVCVQGVGPSGAVTRTVQASGSGVHAAVAAGLLTIGEVHGGAGEDLGRMFDRCRSSDAPGMAAEVVEACRARGRRVPGFGHPFHPQGDPRAEWLLDIAAEVGVSGRHCAALGAVSSLLGAGRSRPVLPNVDGATVACLMDMGISWRFAVPVIMVSRSIGLSAHAIEESARGDYPTVGTGDDVAYLA